MVQGLEVLEIEADGEGFGWGNFLRMGVEIDITKPLTRGKWLTIDKKMWHSFKYEIWLTFCFHYGVIKHQKRACPKLKPWMTLVNELNSQYGPWLSANPAKTNGSVVKKYVGEAC